MVIFNSYVTNYQRVPFKTGDRLRRCPRTLCKIYWKAGDPGKGVRGLSPKLCTKKMVIFSSYVCLPEGIILFDTHNTCIVHSKIHITHTIVWAYGNQTWPLNII